MRDAGLMDNFGITATIEPNAVYPFGIKPDTVFEIHNIPGIEDGAQYVAEGWDWYGEDGITIRLTPKAEA